MSRHYRVTNTWRTTAIRIFAARCIRVSACAHAIRSRHQASPRYKHLVYRINNQPRVWEQSWCPITRAACLAKSAIPSARLKRFPKERYKFAANVGNKGKRNRRKIASFELFCSLFWPRDGNNSRLTGLELKRRLAVVEIAQLSIFLKLRDNAVLIGVALIFRFFFLLPVMRYYI